MIKLLIAVVLSCVTCLSDAQQGEWTWMKGSNTVNSPGSYGTMGVSSPTNTPPALYEALEWTDHQGNFWLFGGFDGQYFSHGALWKFDPSTNEWTWMKGSSGTDFGGVYGTLGVSSPSNYPGARFSCVSWVDTAGNLFLWGGYAFDATGNSGFTNDLWKYDIATGEWTWLSGSNTVYQSGIYGTQGVGSILNTPGARAETNASWVDAQNNLWMFGGGDNGATFYNDLWKYDQSTNEWTWMSGSNLINQPGVYGTQGVADPSNVPGSRMIYAKWKDNAGNFWIYGGLNYNSTSFYNDLWKYDVSTNEWAWMSGSSGSNSSGTYASTCVSGPSYISSCRSENRVAWTDACGKFWFFGGANVSGYSDYYNDLWRYDPSSNEWTWINGSSSPLQNGSFGTQGVAAASNVPPGLWGGNAFMGTDGSLWLFGGSRLWGNFDNALWKFVPDPNCGGCASNAPVSLLQVSQTSVCEKFCINFYDSSTNTPTSWLWLFPGGTPSSSPTSQNPSQICYQLPGVYDVTLITSNAYGTDTLSLPGYITVNATPAIPVITQNGYVLTSTSATSYQWQFNNTDIPGATNQSYNVPQSGYYTVVITDQNGCTSSATTYVLISGLGDLISDWNLAVHPNPSDGHFIIEWLNGQQGTHISIEVYNTLGQLIFSSEEKINSDHFSKEIDVHAQPEAVYILNIKTGEQRLTKKLVITK